MTDNNNPLMNSGNKMVDAMNAALKVEYAEAFEPMMIDLITILGVEGYVGVGSYWTFKHNLDGTLPDLPSYIKFIRTYG